MAEAIRASRIVPVGCSSDTQQSIIITAVYNIQDKVIMELRDLNVDPELVLDCNTQFAALLENMGSNRQVVMIVGTWLSYAAGIRCLSDEMDLACVINEADKRQKFMKRWSMSGKNYPKYLSA